MLTPQDLINALEQKSFVVSDMIENHSDIVSLLIDAQDKEGNPLFKADMITDILFNAKDIIIHQPDILKATLNNPQAIEYLTGTNNRSSYFCFLLNNPSELEKVTLVDKSVHKNKVTNKDLLKTLDEKPLIVAQIIKEHPDIVQLFIQAKDEYGQPVFNKKMINDLLFDCRYTIKKHPDIIKATLTDADAIDVICFRTFEERGHWEPYLRRPSRFRDLINDPLPTTVHINPQAFDFAPKKKASMDDLICASDAPCVNMGKYGFMDIAQEHPDVVQSLIDATDKEGNPLFNDIAIVTLLNFCQNTIKRHPDVVKATLSDPEVISKIAANKDYNSRGNTLKEFICYPLKSTFQKEPKIFKKYFQNDLEINRFKIQSDVFEMLDTYADTARFLSDIKDKDGRKLFFDTPAVVCALFYCQSTLEKNPNIIKVILKNPKSVDQIARETPYFRSQILKKLCKKPLKSTDMKNKLNMIFALNQIKKNH